MQQRRVCFISQRDFPGDARLETQIRALQEAGYSVDMICMKSGSRPLANTVQGTRIYRIPSLPRLRASKLRYVLEYASFWLPAFILITILHLIRRYSLVHVTNLPDTLVFAAVVPKLLGAKIIFDVRECTPEMFVDRFGAKPQSRVIRLMAAVEQAAIRFANASVTCTDQMRQALIRRGGSPDKISVMLNVGSGRLQALAPMLPDPTASANPFRIVTHGTIIKRYGHEVLIRAMPQIIREIPHVKLEIIGRGQAALELKQLVAQLGVQDHVTFLGFVPEGELFTRLRSAHCGVVPILRNPEADLVHTYKMFEYIHLGLPIIISRTSAVEAYFDDDSLYFTVAGNPESLAQAIIDLAQNPQKRHDLAHRARETYDNSYAPHKQRAVYARLVNQLLDTPIGGARLKTHHENAQP